MIGFGPLDEKDTTDGANVSILPILFKIVAVAFLHSS